MTERVAKKIVRDIAHSAIVPGDRVIRSAEVARVGGRPTSHDGEPMIELITEANIVRAIDVTCACGHKMRLWCSYETDDRGTAANK
jgi:hypothetical protein